MRRVGVREMGKICDVALVFFLGGLLVWVFVFFPLGLGLACFVLFSSPFLYVLFKGKI